MFIINYCVIRNKRTTSFYLCVHII